MIKKTIFLLIFILFVVLFFFFLKDSNYAILKEIVNFPKEKIEGFLEEKKENIVEEIDMEKENIKETLREKGIKLWEDIGNSIFKKETDIDNEG